MQLFVDDMFAVACLRSGVDHDGLSWKTTDEERNLCRLQAYTSPNYLCEDDDAGGRNGCSDIGLELAQAEKCALRQIVLSWTPPKQEGSEKAQTNYLRFSAKQHRDK